MNSGEIEFNVCMWNASVTFVKQCNIMDELGFGFIIVLTRVEWQTTRRLTWKLFNENGRRGWLEPRDSACAHLKLNKNYCYIKMFNKAALI